MPRTARRGTKRSEDYEEKPLSQIAGYVAGDPEVRDGSEGDEFTTFRVGSNRFYDDENPDATRWYSIAINKPALQDFVLAKLSKGTAVVVEGSIRKVDKDGSTYFNMTGYRVGLVDWFVAGSDGRSGSDYDPDDDL